MSVRISRIRMYLIWLAALRIISWTHHQPSNATERETVETNTSYFDCFKDVFEFAPTSSSVCQGEDPTERPPSMVENATMAC
jgi:hypothetical protein